MLQKIDTIQFKAEYTHTDDLLHHMFLAASSTSNILYRGISRDEEKYPKIMRVWTGEKYRAIHYTKEIPMLQDFRKYGASLLDGNYGALDFVSCAQHFGVPTRLLDWTSNPFVALFFSLSAKPSQDKNFGYRVFICEKRRQLVLDDIYFTPAYDERNAQSTDTRIGAYEDFIQRIGNTEELQKICTARKIRFNEETLNRFIVLNTNDSNPRLNAQQGLFVMPKSRDMEKIDKEYTAAGVQTMYVDARLRETLLKQLELLGYSTIRLFFDLQNISNHILDKALYS